MVLVSDHLINKLHNSVWTQTKIITTFYRVNGYFIQNPVVILNFVLEKAAYFLTPWQSGQFPRPVPELITFIQERPIRTCREYKKNSNQFSNFYWFDLKADYFSRIILILWLYVLLFILVVREKLLYNDLNTNITSNTLLDLNWLNMKKIKFISLSSFCSFTNP